MGNVIRTIFIGLDVAVYGLLEQVFQLIINLANFDLFGSTTISEFSKRIYLILGLVMVFKLLVAFIQILIDPDKISDKENGVGNILKRVAISVLLIVLVPSIFTEAKKIQNYVLPIIPRVVLSVPVDVSNNNVDNDANETTKNTSSNDEVMVSAGRLMSYYSFLPFFYYSDEECNNYHLMGTGDDSQATIHSVAEAANEVNDKNCPQVADGYTYNYKWLLSTAVGIYLLYVLVTVALKIAIRTIKFGLCQIIAPIPIASYIDTSTSKKAFDNWVSTSVKVYLDLFIRLFIVYFVIFIFSILFDGSRIQDILKQYEQYGSFQGFLVLLFIIIGLLNFAKEMPKFITGMLGVSDSFSDIGDMFKGQGWRSLGGMAGTGLASLRSAQSNYQTSRDAGEHMGTRLRRAIGGFAGAQRRGLSAVGSGKGFREAYTDNFNTTTAISARSVAKKATIRQSKEERENNLKALARKRNETISQANNDFNDRRYGRFEGKSRDEIMSMLYDEEFESVSNERNARINSVTQAKNTEDHFRNIISQALTRGDTATADRYREQLNRAVNRRKHEETKLSEVQDRYDKLSRGEISVDEYDKKYNEYISAKMARDAAIDKANKDYESAIRLVPTEISPTRSAILDQVLGRQTVTSESYSKAASTMTSTKSEALGEARAKLVESGQNLKVKVNGQEFTYGDFLRAKSSIKPGDTTVKFNGIDNFDINRFNSMFETATKAADVAFVNAVAAGKIENAKIEKILKNYDDFLNTLNIDDRAIVDELKTMFKTNPGAAIKKAGDYAEGMQRKAAQMSTVEQITRQQQQEKKS